MPMNDWQEICKYAIMDKERVALLKVIEVHSPDDVMIYPSSYSWSYIRLCYWGTEVTVTFDPIKITVSSHKGEEKFGFDDCSACLRYLDEVLAATRTSAFG